MGKISYFPVFPIYVNSESTSYPEDSLDFPRGISRVINTLPTLTSEEKHEIIYSIYCNIFHLNRRIRNVKKFNSTKSVSLNSLTNKNRTL